MAERKGRREGRRKKGLRIQLRIRQMLRGDLKEEKRTTHVRRGSRLREGWPLRIRSEVLVSGKETRAAQGARCLRFRGNLGEELLPLFLSGLFCSVQLLSGHVGCIRLREAPACFLTAQTFLGDPWIYEQSRPQSSLQSRPQHPYSQQETCPQELVDSSCPSSSKPPSDSTYGVSLIIHSRLVLLC